MTPPFFFAVSFLASTIDQNRSTFNHSSHDDEHAVHHIRESHRYAMVYNNERMQTQQYIQFEQTFFHACSLLTKASRLRCNYGSCTNNSGQPCVKPARHPQSMYGRSTRGHTFTRAPSHLSRVPLYPVNTRSSFINKSNQLRESRRR